VSGASMFVGSFCASMFTKSCGPLAVTASTQHRNTVSLRMSRQVFDLRRSLAHAGRFECLREARTRFELVHVHARVVERSPSILTIVVLVVARRLAAVLEAVVTSRTARPMRTGARVEFYVSNQSR